MWSSMICFESQGINLNIPLLNISIEINMDMTDFEWSE